MTLGQEMRWAYSTTLPSPHGAHSGKEKLKKVMTMNVMTSKVMKLVSI